MQQNFVSYSFEVIVFVWGFGIFKTVTRPFVCSACLAISGEKYLATVDHTYATDSRQTEGQTNSV